MQEGNGHVAWYLVLLAVVWGAFWLLVPQGSDRAELPYSAFVGQVASGNVTSVTFQGNRVEGTLRRAVPLGGGGTLGLRATKPQETTGFATQLPPVADPRLMPLLGKEGVVVGAKPEPGHWWLDLLLVGAPMVAVLYILGRGSGGAAGPQAGRNPFTFGQSRAKLYTAERPRTTFADVAGVEEAKHELAEVVEFLTNPRKFHALGAKIPKGVLLVGPPGTGKTLLARAVAGEAKVPFFSISATEFVEMFVGVGASRVRDLFEKAKAKAPAIIFVDEIDAVGRRRGVGVGNVNDEREQTLNQLLSEMDGFEPTASVIVIAATNRPDVLDPALLRPGRFDRQVGVELPERAGRQAILTIHTQRVPLAPEVDLKALAAGCVGFSGADLANLVNEAAIVAARKGHARVLPEDFDEAHDKILMGVKRTTLLDPKERRLVAYHEAGHTLVAHLVPGADPIHKVTIVPHGHALGVTQLLPLDDKHNFPKSYLLDKIAVQLGGRAAEELVFGEVTTGAQNDLVEMSRLARRMISHWGMGTRVGPMAYADDGYLGPEGVGEACSEETRALIDGEVRELTHQAYERSMGLLRQHREQLVTLAEALLREEVLDQAQIAALIGRREAQPAGLETA